MPETAAQDEERERDETREREFEAEGATTTHYNTAKACSRTMATNSATKRKRGESAKKDLATTEKKKNRLPEDGGKDEEIFQLRSENEALRKRLHEAEEKIAELNGTIA